MWRGLAVLEYFGFLGDDGCGLGRCTYICPGTGGGIGSGSLLVAFSLGVERLSMGL